jgi:signal transduction histidine kinase
VTCEIQPDLPQPLVSPDLIRQVFINMLRNSQDALEAGGELKIKGESKMEYDGEGYRHVVCVTISDTGSGIKKEHLGHVFDPFFTTKSSDKGTGLGLSVSYGIIQMYQGSIDVQSEEGKGTTVIVTLPVEPVEKHESPSVIETANPAVENGSQKGSSPSTVTP